jgi:hypothetical protein
MGTANPAGEKRTLIRRKMKKFFKRPLMGVFAALLAILMVYGVVYAFTGSPLTSTGSITVAATEDYHLSGSIMNFASISKDSSTPFSTTATITIYNDGDSTINGVELTSINYPTNIDSPLLTAVLTTTPLAKGEQTTITFTLTGTTQVTNIDLTSLTCTMTPTSS